MYIHGQAPGAIELAGEALGIPPLQLLSDADGGVAISAAIGARCAVTVSSRRDGRIWVRWGYYGDSAQGVGQRADSWVECDDVGQSDDFAEFSASSWRELPGRPLIQQIAGDGSLLDGVPRPWPLSVALVVQALRHFRPDRGCEVTIRCPQLSNGNPVFLPAVAIAACGAFSVLHGQPLGQTELVRIAVQLTSRLLRAPAASSRYYTALLGGINFCAYKVKTAIFSEPLVADQPISVVDELNRGIVLAETGAPCCTGNCQRQAVKNFFADEVSAAPALHELKRAALGLQAELQAVAGGRPASWSRIGEYMRRSRQYFRRLTGMTLADERVTHQLAAAEEAGAAAVEICGGWIVALCPPEQRDAVAASLTLSGAKPVQSAALVGQGLEVAVT